MPWNYDANHPFAGIAEKLQRSEQNILDLHSEIDLFITNGQYPVIPHPEDKTFQEATEYHKTKMIPLRFGVLAGEVVHHLRSCLDHIVWHFSDDASRAKPRSIEFPIFEVKPSNKKEIETYERKVKGISNANVLRMIEESQPYRAGPILRIIAFSSSTTWTLLISIENSQSLIPASTFPSRLTFPNWEKKYGSITRANSLPPKMSRLVEQLRTMEKHPRA